MKVDVLIDRSDVQPAWIVCSCNICVRFNNESAANSYARKLESRLNAPHSWPGQPAQSLQTNPRFAREMQPRVV